MIGIGRIDGQRDYNISHQSLFLQSLLILQFHFLCYITKKGGVGSIFFTRKGYGNDYIKNHGSGA